MGPGNIRGKYNFMSLETGAQINGRVVATLPITDEVIDRVEALGQAQNQPYRTSKMLQYEWRPGQAMAQDDAILPIEDEAIDNGIIPPPIPPQNDITDTPIAQIINQGVEAFPPAEEDDESDEEQGVMEDQGVANQGVENQGVAKI